MKASGTNKKANFGEVPILTYHKIQNGFEFGINRVSIKAFKEQINYLYQRGYQTTTLAHSQGKILAKEPNKYVVITFDDGDESVFYHAFPILKENGFAATVFVISDFVGSNNSWDHNLWRNESTHLNWQQLKCLSDNGWEIGSHTVSHADLTKLTAERMEFELKKSREAIYSHLHAKVDYICYPFNRYSEAVIAKSVEAGYQGACVFIKRSMSNKAYDQFIRPRFGVYSIDTIRSFRNKLSQQKSEAVKQRVISFFSTGTVIYKQLKNKKTY